MEKERLLNLLSHFSIEGTPKGIVPVGNGLINDTYKVTTVEKEKPDYILQRINNNIFVDVELLQSNIEIVTDHIRKKLKAQATPDIDRRVLRFIKTDTGKAYYKTPDGEYWRMMLFIANAESYEDITPQHAYEAGKAFGDFESMLIDLKGTIGESIPDFHNMELRTAQLRQAIAANCRGRLDEVRDLVDNLDRRADEMGIAERLFRAGKLPKRICHCDTKVNNMLFDSQGEFLCVIDLDTVMPSFVFSDYGDFLRTGANSTAEDDPDLSHVKLRKDIIESFTIGYIEGTKSFLTQVEKELLPFAMTLFPFMQCVRFLTDYLNGDIYYKIKYPKHNLDRARNQYRLYELTVEESPKLQQLIEKL
jgi:Ser/Thr protein kinase RdoA (MazF antagonist)